MQEEPESVDLGGGASDDDPFAEIPADPLPEGVEPGELGGYDPSQGEEPAEPEGEEEPGEFLHDPEAEEPAQDAQEEEPPPAEPTPEPESEPEEQPEAEATPEPEPAESDPGVEPEAPTEPPESEAAPEETPEPPSPSRGGRRGRKAGAVRPYQILQRKSEKGPWAEELVVETRTREQALREGYRKLAKKPGEDALTLVAIPVDKWRPATVKGKKREDYAISVG